MKRYHSKELGMVTIPEDAPATCNHRTGDGAATADEIAAHAAGDVVVLRWRHGYECPTCGCTLGCDGYWYVEAFDAPINEP